MLLFDVFVFILDIFFHFALLVFTENACVPVLFSFEFAFIILVEGAELDKRELHVFLGINLEIVADVMFWEFFVLDIHRVPEDLEVRSFVECSNPCSFTSSCT